MLYVGFNLMLQRYLIADMKFRFFRVDRELLAVIRFALHTSILLPQALTGNTGIAKPFEYNIPYLITCITYDCFNVHIIW